MKEKKINNNKKRKLNIFIIFLVCSSLIWLISKLSENYAQRTTFNLAYENVPDSLLLTGSSKQQIDTRLQASGFKFLGFNFGKKDIRIDLSQVRNNGNSFFVQKEEYQKQIEEQLPDNMALLSVDQDTLFVYFKKLFTKEVEVVADINLELAQNHMLEGQLKIDPPFVTVKGPQNEVEVVDRVYTVNTSLTAVSESFNSSLKLARTPEMLNTTYSTDRVEVSGDVFRFSEQLIEIPVRVDNLPEGTEIKTFPNTISVLCKAKIDRLKSLRPQEFELVADFNTIGTGESKLDVQLKSKPEDVYDAQLKQNKVEFILIRR